MIDTAYDSCQPFVQCRQKSRVWRFGYGSHLASSFAASALSAYRSHRHCIRLSFILDSQYGKPIASIMSSLSLQRPRPWQTVVVLPHITLGSGLRGIHLTSPTGFFFSSPLFKLSSSETCVPTWSSLQRLCVCSIHRDA